MGKAKPAPAPPTRPAEYTVVARRYRPQQFAELIGQEHVAQALANALQTGRVAHAYLFTGARGVGKTSAARILAKALNCVEGPTATPCDTCDSCQAIATGEDVDVLEIDGASNRGIEDARELRQNSGFRPTRSRFKVYIIDEIHMLTREAFNALLKTLEEPPPHVKFIFATTEVQKIPITILSRCQRFDFAHVGPANIFAQLKRVVEGEGYAADDAALKLIARRAAGSMRDSQSLLDQLLASAPEKLTTDHVHAVLGTAGDERVVELATAILDGDPKTALTLIGGWVDRGLQIGEMVDQLTDYWRALMLLRCAPELPELPITPGTTESLTAHAKRVSLDAILTGLDIWTTTKARMRGSAHTQVLLEMAVVRLSRLEELLSVGSIIASLASGSPVSQQTANGSAASSGMGPGRGEGSVKKNGMTGSEDRQDHAINDGETSSDPIPLVPDSLPLLWARLQRDLADRSPLLANHLKNANLPAIFGPNSLAIRFVPRYTHAYEACATEQSQERLQDGLRKLTGQAVTVKVELVGDSSPGAAAANVTPVPPTVQTADRRKHLMNLPLFQKAKDALGAQLWHVDDGYDPTARPPAPDTEPDTDDVPADPDEV